MRILPLLLMSAAALSCGGASEPEAAPPEAESADSIPPLLARPDPEEAGPTNVYVSDVMVVFNGLRAGISQLHGTLSATQPGTIPFLNDPDSFSVRLEEVELVLPIQTLSIMLTRETDKAEKMPFEELEILPQGDSLLLRGRLKGKLSIKVELQARPYATKDGQLGLEFGEVRVMGVSLDKTLGKLGLHLDDLTKKMRQNRSVQIEQDTITIDVFAFATRPRIYGAITGVSVNPDGLVVRVEPSGSARQAPEARSVADGLNDDQTNYIALRGGTARFGKSTLHNVDFTLVDQDSSDPLLIGAEQFGQQFQGGYMKPQPGGGTIGFMPDMDQVQPVDEAVAKLNIPR